MGDFFSLRGNKAKTVEEVPLGVESAGTPAAHISAAARENVERDVSVATAKRGRPRKNAGDSAGNSDDVSRKVNEAVIAQLDALHDPKAWEALLCLPADAALTLTGKDRWNLKERERETLGVTGSAAARTMMITNPRALAFFMLGSAVFAVYVPRAIAELKEMRAAQQTKAKTAEVKNDKPAG